MDYGQRIARPGKLQNETLHKRRLATALTPTMQTQRCPPLPGHSKKPTQSPRVWLCAGFRANQGWGDPHARIKSPALFT